MPDEIQLLQFIICKDFRHDKQDYFIADQVHSNIYAKEFPLQLSDVYVVTCWRKDQKFHKEVIEYQTEKGEPVRTPHMDIEPVTDSVLFRWHKHQFPTNLVIAEPTILTIRVILDWKLHWQTYIMIEASDVRRQKQEARSKKQEARSKKQEGMTLLTWFLFVKQKQVYSVVIKQNNDH